MFKEFLEKIQAADEDRKRRWVFISTVIIIIGVGYLWLGYFNNLLGRLGQNQPQEVERVSGFSFLETMKIGVATIVDALKSVLNHPKSYIIKP